MPYLQVFDFFDMDSSGKIDSYEFVCGLALLSHTTLEEKAEAIFSLYDFDSSKVLNNDELVVLFRCVLCSLMAMSGRRDIPSIMEVEKKVVSILLKYDTNNDGFISLDEFKSIVTKDEEILRCLKSYNLVSSEDLRKDFGGGEDIPLCDSDLEAEGQKGVEESDILQERSKLGIELGVKETEEGYYLEDQQKSEISKKAKNITKNFYKAEPNQYKPDRFEGETPDISLEIEYIYGYRCQDTRNNIRYAPNGDLVYHTACVGIMLNKNANTQKFYLGHYNDITALAMYDNLVATGQVGKDPLIQIWDYKSQQTKATIKGFLKKGIGHLAFSHDGKKLAAVSIAEQHNIFVFDVAKLMHSKTKSSSKFLLANGQGPAETVFCMSFDVSNNGLILGCRNGIYFAGLHNGQVNLKPGTGWSDTNKQTILNCVAIESLIVTGSYSGNILVWKNLSLAQTITAHNSACTAIWKRRQGKGIISGGNDGVVIVWDGALNRLHSTSLRNLSLDLMNFKIRAVCEDSNGDITIGTRGGEIVEIKLDGSAHILNRGHFKGDLSALAMVPGRQEFVTMGEDGFIAVWDIQTRQIRRSAKLSYKSRAIAISRDGKQIAVGCNNGYILICDFSNFQVMKTLKDRNSRVNEVKFSPNGEWLSAGGVDCEIISYSAKENYIFKSRMRAHQGEVIKFDFSSDSKFLQSLDTQNELVYSEVDKGKKIIGGMSFFRDERWNSWTLPIGWPVQGIWPPFCEGDEINAVDRSPDMLLLASADDFGCLKIFRYPCPSPNAAYYKYIGHSSHVTNVKFSENQNYLISTGGNDKSIIQWKLKKRDDEGFDETQTGREKDEDELFFEKLENPNFEELASKAGELPLEENEDDGPIVEPKAFLIDVKQSTPAVIGEVEPKNSCPNQNLSIGHVIGFRSIGAKNLVKYNHDDKAVFVTAAIGVVMETSKRNQTYFTLHQDDIISLGMHPKRKICATGQMSAQSGAKRRIVPIFVWNTDTKQIISKLDGMHENGVSTLKFSPDGSKLLSVGHDRDHSVAIWDWANSRIIVSSKVDRGIVTDAAFKTESEFLTVGVKQIKFWTIMGGNLNCVKGRWGATKPEPTCSCVFGFPQNICFIGGYSGQIYTWQGGSCTRALNAHHGAVRVLVAYKNALYSGGDDGKIKSWSFSGKLQLQSELIAMSEFTVFNTAIRSLDLKSDGTMLVGTRGAEIFEITSDQKSKSLIQAHCEGELWGLAVHPITTRFATCGGDKTIRLWDAASKSMINSKVLEEPCRAIDWSHNGQFLAVATISGKILLLDMNLHQLHSLSSTFNKENQLIEEIKISPDGTMVAFGAHNSTEIEIQAITNNKLVSKGFIRGLNSSLKHLDWSEDSGIIVVNSEANELKFCSVNNMKLIASTSARDVRWHSWTCTLGWPVQGIHPSEEDFKEVNTVCRANNLKLLASGEKSKSIKLFHYPTVESGCEFKEYKVHSSGITRVRFMTNDSYLVSTSGQDRTIIIWDTDFGNEEGMIEDEEPEMEEENIDERDVVTIVEKELKEKETQAGYDLGDEIGVRKKNQKGIFIQEQSGGGDQFMSVKPWQGTIKAPRKYLKPPVSFSKAPRLKIKLHHVFGFRAKDVRNNLKLVDGRAVFFTAALVISQNISSGSQTYFKNHDDDITALAINSQRTLIATGQIGKKPKICIFNAETMIEIQTLTKGILKGVNSLAFSTNSVHLLAVSIDKNHTLTVFNTANGTIVSQTRGDSSPILSSLWKTDDEFVTVGIRHFKLWKLGPGGVTSKRGLFGKDSSRRIVCCALNNKDVLAGATNGTLQIWKGTSIGKTLPIHKSCLDCITVTEQK